MIYTLACPGQDDVCTPVDRISHTPDSSEDIDQWKTISSSRWGQWGGGLEAGEQDQGGPEQTWK